MPARKPSEPATTSAAAFVPHQPHLSLVVLREAAQGCRGCDLYKRATQTVFGRGVAGAPVMLVGEQPGDQEDKIGAPFVGPAGRVLTDAMEEAGLERSQVYTTNAVKHFKWEPRGKRRLHAKPSARQISACKPWLEAEIAVVRPRLLVAMGAVASQSLLGPSFRLTRHRGEFVRGTRWAELVLATIHPSAVLRAIDEAARQQMFEGLVADLRLVVAQLHGPSARAAAGREAQRPDRPAVAKQGRSRRPQRSEARTRPGD
jgi:DNA polymerase